MHAVKRYGSTIFALVCIAVTGAGVYNVYGDNGAAVELAKKAACADAKECSPAETSEERTPFGQTFTMNVPKGSVVVTCHRAAYLVGSYACVAK